MKSAHYPHGYDLHHALHRLLDPERYEIRQIDRYDPPEYARSLDRETREVLAGFLAWLGQTRGGDGLTSEREADYRARADLGVRVTSERGGAIVIRVPKRSIA